MSIPVKRYYLVESFRVIAALLVALYHYLLFNEGEALFPSLDNRMLFFELLKTVVLTFFILTAIVIPVHFDTLDYRLRDYPVFLLKRLIRVQLPYLVTIAVIIAVENCFSLYRAEGISVDLQKLSANVFLYAEFKHVPWYNTIFWTLAIEMQFYFMIGIVYPFIRKTGLPGIAVYFLTGEILHVLWTDSRFFWYYTPYFTIGMVIYFFYSGKISSLSAALISCSLALLVWFMHDRYAAPVTILVPLFLLFLPDRKSFISGLGKYSFSFYLIHGITGGTFLYLFRNTGEGTFGGIIRLLAAIVVTFTATWIFYRLAEKPSMRLTHRINYRKK